MFSSGSVASCLLHFYGGPLLHFLVFLVFCYVLFALFCNTFWKEGLSTCIQAVRRESYKAGCHGEEGEEGEGRFAGHVKSEEGGIHGYQHVRFWARGWSFQISIDQKN